MNNLSSPVASITSGPRQSNFELLRIVAMFLVLVIHASYASLGVPTAEDFTDYPVSAITRSFIQSLSIVSVNVFVLISGWFGIKPSLKGFTAFIFQCAYFMFGTYAVMLLLGWSEFSINKLLECFSLTSFYWFVTSYVGLYILSPILNAYIKSATERQYRWLLIAFFIFQTIYGWRNSAPYFQRGYSAFSFIGLYLLAQYIKAHKQHIVNKLYGGTLYIATTLANMMFLFFATKFHIPLDPYVYVSPLVIGGAIGLLLFFADINIRHNKYINFVAKSAFAVYLLHQNPNLFIPYFMPLIQEKYASLNGIECIGVIFITLAGIFLISIVLDQPRKWLWSAISNRLFTKARHVR